MNRLLDINPNVQKPSSILAWATWDGTATPILLDSHNASSVSDDGAGNWTITWSQAIAPGTDYAVLSFARFNESNATAVGLSIRNATYLAATSVAVTANEMATDTQVDCNYLSLIAVGAP